MSGMTAIAGCSLPGQSGGTSTTVTHVYVLNRRAQEYSFELEVEYDDEQLLDRSRSISGTTNESRPTALTYADFPDSPGQYQFAFRVADGEWLRTTPSGLNVTESGQDCVRVTFVINLGDRVTGYAQRGCAEN